jgi:hypothetical protein
MDKPVILNWRGPFKMGSLPDTKTAIASLRIPVIYLFFRCYEGDATLVYVGQTTNFSDRLAQHYSEFVSSKAGTIYHHDGSIFCEGGLPNYFRNIQNNLNELLKYTREDAARTVFIYAPIADRELRSSVEMSIMAQLEHLPTPPFIKWNTVPRDPKTFPIQSDYSDLKLDLFTFEESKRLIEVIFPILNTSA